MTAKLLAAYGNGNTKVALFSDGTKYRSWPDGEEPTPQWPESIDLKITDYCDAECLWCHESSTVRGNHATLYWNVIDDIFRGAPQGMEVAIGGGNPLSHPGLDYLLEFFREKGMIANLTVNARHLGDARDRLLKLVEKRLVYGVGISYTPNRNNTIQNFLEDCPNSVLHVIAGLDPIHLIDSAKRVLVLGYKDYGRGQDVHPSERRMKEWRERFDHASDTFRSPGGIVSFDNLAIEQLNPRLTREAWERTYMGDDGTFTFYLDLATDRFAISSTSERHPREKRNLEAMLAEVRRMARQT